MKPNVVLITADHMRFDALGCNGHPVVRTPNLDRLAASGVRFSNSFTPNPICVPARASITTGNYSHRCTGNKGNGGLVRDGQPKIAEHFARAGYSTCAMGKLHYVPYAPPDQPRLLHGFQHAELCESGRIIRQYDPTGRRRGLEDYHDYLHTVGWGGYERSHGVGNNDVRPCPSPLPPEHYVDAWVAARTVDWIGQHRHRSSDTPFFMWASFPKPHSPYDPPEPYDRLYDPRQLPAPIGHQGLLDGRLPRLARSRVQYGWDLLSPEAIRVARAHYFGMVSFQDEMVGRIVNALDDLDIRGNTVVVYASDHGDLLGDFGCFFKCNFLNGSVRVPILLSAPGRVQAGLVRDQFVGLQDLLPTLCALTECPLGEPVDGQDLTPMLDDASVAGRDAFISQCLASPNQGYMIYTGQWKYLYTQTGGVEELYDVRSDPDELLNLAGDGQHDGVMADLRARLVAWCRDHGDLDMLDGDDLCRAPLDPDEPLAFNAGSMGWRWY